MFTIRGANDGKLTFISSYSRKLQFPTFPHFCGVNFLSIQILLLLFYVVANSNDSNFSITIQIAKNSSENETTKKIILMAPVGREILWALYASCKKIFFMIFVESAKYGLWFLSMSSGKMLFKMILNDFFLKKTILTVFWNLKYFLFSNLEVHFYSVQFLNLKSSVKM